MVCSTDRHRGVTLVEVIVSISVILVLMAILQPALRSARESARSTACLSTLKQIGVATEILSKENGGYWPGPREGDWPYTITGSANTARATWPLDWSVWWVMRYENILWERQNPNPGWAYRVDPTAVACPAVLASVDREFAWGQQDTVAAMSYVLSPTLVTDHRAWDPGAPERRQRLADFARRVPTASVGSPSAKIALMETADHHGDGAPVGQGAARFNAMLCDLSARRVDASGVRAGLPFLWPEDSSGIAPLVPGETVTGPGLGTINGYLGSDF